MFRDDQYWMCGLCEKPIAPNEARVNFGRKTYHGQCFVDHCKKNHTLPKNAPKFDHEEADAMEDK